MYKILKIEFPFKLDINFILSALKILVILVVGFFLIRLLSNIALKVFKKRLSEQAAMVLRKILFYTGLALIVLVVLNELGIDLTPFLGAAGIIGVAVGFASQTSISNIISGLFLISEKSFAIGDLIKVGDTVGSILSIDLLSVKIKTFDNQYIRIPNEKIFNSELTNITYYPIRRIDFNIKVAYTADMKKVKDILCGLAEKNPFCLDEPNPLIAFSTFAESGIELLFAVWCAKNDYMQCKNSIMYEIKTGFEKEHIEFAFPHCIVDLKR